MSVPQTYDLNLYRGDTYKWTFQLWKDEQRTQPVDLTGVTAEAALQQNTTTTALACTITSNEIAVVLDAADSQKLTVAGPTQTNSTWDLQLTYTDGTIKTIVAGAVTVRADVTGAA